jgi:hypothetical protein
MDFGSRHIRTAGRGSGSIEITLPTDLRDLVGLTCRVTLRDGARPDIVLQPDLQLAQAAFAALWRAMAAALARDGDVPALPLTEFGFGLQPSVRGGDEPYLCWRDGLSLARGAPHDPIAISRTLAAFGHALAPDLRIAPNLAAGFGAVCGYLAAGVVPSADGWDARGIAASFLQTIRPGAPLSAAEAVGEGAYGPEFWGLAAPFMSAAADVFLGWAADPSGHVSQRATWRRGLSIEMSGG